MKGFDDHLDNYGHPGPEEWNGPGDDYYPGSDDDEELTPDHLPAEEEEAWRDEADYENPEPPFDQNHYMFHTPAGPNPQCANCEWLNWQQDDGITTDDFDNWPRGREFPS